MGWRRSCMMACAAAVLSCATTPADVDREDRVCHAAVDTEEAAAAGGSANRGCGCGVNKLKRSLEDLFGTGHKGTTHKAHDGKGRRSGGATEGMVLIEGGSFFMGTDSPIIHGDGEGPARPVVLSSFYIDRFAVPNRDFEVFIQTTKYETDNEKFGWSFVFEGLLSLDALKKIDKAVAGAEWWVPVKDVTWRSPEGPESDVFSSERGNHPVVQVTWNDAKAFCEWRGARLPTEAEWEYAALGGRRGGTLFPWGNTLQPSGEHKANIWQGTFPKQNMVDDGYYGTCPVDALGPQNDYGLYNMIGNVWEWVADTWTTTHSREEQVEPLRSSLQPVEELAASTATMTFLRRYDCFLEYLMCLCSAGQSQRAAGRAGENQKRRIIPLPQIVLLQVPCCGKTSYYGRQRHVEQWVQMCEGWPFRRRGEGRDVKELGNRLGSDVCAYM